ncbi:BAG domain [Dillenia turbinata]|uniref:BAG domain n=1 Tax=Dillenia turbinata TaxID=194707 RepID=A0AAN8UYK2_9MAGN
MHSVYSYADHPHQRNQMPFVQCHHPNFDAVVPQMKVEPARFPTTQEFCPYGGSYGYPAPMAGHFCCGHNHAPCYYSCRPPYPYPPQPVYHCYGNFPAFPGANAVHYVPPPHYSVEQPRYEYDKNVPTMYYCGSCPHHSSNFKGDKSVKIEEHEPEVVKERDGSVVPFQWKNSPYPIMWMPPGYLQHAEHRRPSDLQVKNEDETPYITKVADGNVISEERRPSWRGGRLPHDMANIGSLWYGGDTKKDQQQAKEENKNQSPLPIIWMPSYWKSEDQEQEQHQVGSQKHEGEPKKAQEPAKDEKQNQFQLPVFRMPSYNKPEELELEHQQGDLGSKHVREQPWNFQIIPTKLPRHDDDTEKPAEKKEANTNEAPLEIAAGRTIDKSIPVKQEERLTEKSIPVGQEEQPAVKKTAEGVKRKTRDIPVKHIGDNQEMKPSKTGAESKSSPKTTKLPPVCLRVDPLPRKKSRSRPSSPPGMKEKCSTSSEKTKEIHKETKVGKVEEQQNDGKNKEIVPKDNPCDQEQTRSLTDMPTHICDVGSTKLVAQSAETGYAEPWFEAEKGARVAENHKDEETITKDHESADESKTAEDEGDKEVNDMSIEELKRKNLSDAEAATVIQSLYRGFQVRKWEPPKKLKQIAEVREKMLEVRNRIQELESSPHLWRDDKTRLVISETIMTLLLKLDTIQSLQPSVRERRKSVAKELVSLQEKLDFLSAQKVEGQTEAASTAESVEDVTADRTNTKLCIQAQGGEIGGECGQDISQVDMDGSSDTAEQQQCQEQPKMTEDSVSTPEGEPSAHYLVLEKEVSKESKEVTDPFQACDVKSDMAGLMPTVEANAPASCEGSTGQDFLEGLYQSVSPPAVTNELMNSEKEVGGLFSSEPTDSGSNLNIETSPVDDLSSVDDNWEFTDEVGVSVTGEEHTPPSFERNIDGDRTGSEVLHIEEPVYDRVIDNMETEMKCGVADGEVRVSSEIPDGSMLSGEDTAMDKVQHRPFVEVEEHILGESQDAEKIKLQKDDGFDAVELLLPDKPQENVAVDEVHSSKAHADVALASEDRQVRHIGSEEDTALDAWIAEVAEKNLSEEKETLKLETESLGDSTLVEDIDAVEGDTVVRTKITEGGTRADSSQPCANVEIISEHKEVLAVQTGEHTDDNPVAADEKEIVLLESAEQTSNLPPVDAVKDEIAVETETAQGDGEDQLEKTAGHVKDTGNDSERRLVEENEKLREMLEKLMEAGKEQLTVISELSGRVKDLEKKLNRKKRMKLKCSQTPSVRSPRKRLVESFKA